MSQGTGKTGIEIRSLKSVIVPLSFVPFQLLSLTLVTGYMCES